MKNINIKSIRIDGGTQSRAEIHGDTVAEYAEAVKNGANFPPVVVFFDGVDYWLGDGFHRYHGFTQAGKASIPAEVRDGSQRDAVLFSLGANATHGLKRTNADKRKAVEVALAHTEFGQWSDRQLAEACGVSVTFVGSIRRPEVAAKQAENKNKSEAKKSEQKTEKPEKNTKEERPQSDHGCSPTTPIQPVGTLTGGAEPQDATNDDGPTLAELVDELQAENTRLTAEITALAESDDQKAETLKWHRMYEHAMRRQSEAERSAASHQKDAKRLANQVRECCKALGLADPRQLVPTVKKLAARQEAA